MLRNMTGDVNADGRFDKEDICCVRGWLRREWIIVANWNAADPDGSGTLNASDLTRLKRMLLKTETE